MEVIVDDTQLSLAIGKKGQNVRLAAKLLGWKIDIKSEEEKRQEVESQMAALVVSGAPVSVLIDHGLAENIVERLMEGGIGTVEKLGGMTPEELEAIPGIGAEDGGAHPGGGELVLFTVRGDAELAPEAAESRRQIRRKRRPMEQSGEVGRSRGRSRRSRAGGCRGERRSPSAEAGASAARRWSLRRKAPREDRLVSGDSGRRRFPGLKVRRLVERRIAI